MRSNVHGPSNDLSQPKFHLSIIATVRDRDLDRYFHEFQFKTLEGRERAILIGRELSTKPDRILSALLSAGAELPSNQEQALALIKHALAAVSACRYDVTQKCGWSGKEFVFFDQTFGPNPERIRLKSAYKHESRGTLQDWKEGLKGPCKLSSYLTFAISLAFTAPLLRLLKIQEGCGFHFHGWPNAAEGQNARSSSGKTTAARAMTSVLGRCGVNDLLTHDVTPRALTEHCASRNDLALALDEAGRIESSGRASSLAKLAYTIASGRSKEISAQVAQDKNLPNLTWRVLVLSSGEDPLDDRTGAYNRAEGEQVRLIAIPVPAGDMGGIFDRLDVEAHDALLQARAAIDQIETTISDNYGIAAGAYLEQVAFARTETRRMAEEEVGRFLKKANARHPWDRRFAEKFAVVSAGAVIAAEYGVAPWTARQARNRVWRIYKRAKEALKGRATPVIDELVRSVAAAADDATRFPRVEKGARFPRELAENAWGIRRRISGRQVLVLRHDEKAPAISSQFADIDFRHPSWLHLLSKGGDGKRRQVEIKGLTNGRERFFCLDVERLQQLYAREEADK